MGVQRAAEQVRRERELELKRVSLDAFRLQLRTMLREQEISEQDCEELRQQVASRYQIQLTSDDTKPIETEETQQYCRELESEIVELNENERTFRFHAEDIQQLKQDLERLEVGSRTDQTRQQLHSQIENLQQEKQRLQTEIDSVEERKQAVKQRREQLLHLVVTESTRIQTSESTILQGKPQEPEDSGTTVSDLEQPLQERNRFLLVQTILGVLVLAAIVWIGFKVGTYIVSQLGNNGSKSESGKSPIGNSPIDNWISAGERNFTEERDCQNDNLASDKRAQFKADKQKGIDLIREAQREAKKPNLDGAKRKYQEAANALESALKLCGDRGGINIGNAPEARIYYNNARIGIDEAYTLAVAAPIREGNGPVNVRGVAERQAELNEAIAAQSDPRNKPLQRPIKILLLDDGNNEEIAKKLIEEVAANEKYGVLGVIGHQTSDIMMGVKATYERNQLPAISPSATTMAFTTRLPAGRERYVFRTTPGVDVMAQKIHDYMVKDKAEKVVILYSSGNNKDYSEAFKNALIDFRLFGDQTPTYDIDNSKNTTELVDKVNRGEIQSLFIAVSLSSNASGETTLKTLKSIVDQIKQKVKLYGGNALYSTSFLQSLVNQDSRTSIVLVSPWVYLPGRANQQETEFSPPMIRSRNSAFWEFSPNWFTVMSYDATSAFIEAIRRTSPGNDIKQSRESIRAQFGSSDFRVAGAFVDFRFYQDAGRVNFLENNSVGAAKAYLSRVVYCKSNRLNYCYEAVDEQSVDSQKNP